MPLVDKDGKCPICGETAPEPQWLCLRRLTGAAIKGEPCQYSIEGNSRFVSHMAAKLAEGHSR